MNSNFVGEFSYQDGTSKALEPASSSIVMLERLLARSECVKLVRNIPETAWVPVGQDGIRANYKPAMSALGSFRASTYDETLANSLWNRVRPHLPDTRTFTRAANTDWDQHVTWRPVGVNPLLRFIRYEGECLLVGHYDAPYIWNERRRTLMSLVIYLENRDLANPSGWWQESDKEEESVGATRFLNDKQASLPFAQRDFSDWTRPTRPEDVEFVVKPELGKGLMFDHRLLHDAEKIPRRHRKIILRTDIIFEKC